MKQFILTGIFLFSSALACTPVPTSAAVQSAQRQLQEGISFSCAKDRGDGAERTCKKYNMQPQNLARLVAQSIGKSAKFYGGIWIIEDVTNGVVVHVRKSRDGSVAEYMDKVSAYETLTKMLNSNPEAPNFANWPDCEAAGLNKGWPIMVRECKVVNSSAFGKVLQFKVIRQADPSLPKGFYQWYADNGANCGGYVIRAPK